MIRQEPWVFTLLYFTNNVSFVKLLYYSGYWLQNYYTLSSNGLYPKSGNFEETLGISQSISFGA